MEICPCPNLSELSKSVPQKNGMIAAGHWASSTTLTKTAFGYITTRFLRHAAQPTTTNQNMRKVFFGAKIVRLMGAFSLRGASLTSDAEHQSRLPANTRV